MPDLNATIAALLGRAHTEPLRQPGFPTVVLVVFNFAEDFAPPCSVRFRASFPTRTPQPVTIRDAYGNIVPSRIHSQSTTLTSDIPPGYVLWTLTLEFALTVGLPAQTACAFAASYEFHSPIDFDLPLRENLPVYETDCHHGDLPTMFSVAAINAS